MKTLNEHIGELEKQLKSFSFDKIRSKCLYPNCNEDAIYSHSIQENGILDNLEDNIEKAGRKVYSIEDYPDIDFKEKHISTFLRAKRKLRSFGKNDASGLYMFCSKHDKEIFRDIEDIYFENSQRQLFLHSIRAYLFDTRKDFLMYSFTEDKLKTLSELPKSLEMLNKLTKQLDVILKGLPDDYIISEFEASSLNEIKKNSILKALNLEDSQKSLENITFSGKTGAEVKSTLKSFISKLQHIPNIEILIDLLNKGLIHKKTIYQDLFKTFINMVARNSDDSLEYKAWIFKMKVPIAGSFVVEGVNQIESKNNDLNNLTPLFSFTIFPDYKKNETIIILSSILKEESKIFFSKLNTLTDIDLQIAFSNIIALHGTNTFISPRLWDKFSESEKNLFISLKLQKGTFLMTNIDCKLNLFAEKYRE
ncbi:MAG: hypothetical protein KDE33_15185 [Bacteroidetes bacterium]|nr:hypothetical protein [Bacteroidota bacterium]